MLDDGQWTNPKTRGERARLPQTRIRAIDRLWYVYMSLGHLTGYVLSRRLLFKIVSPL